MKVVIEFKDESTITHNNVKITKIQHYGQDVVLAITSETERGVQWIASYNVLEIVNVITSK